MSNRDLYFKGQQDKEELICFFRHHWISLIKEFLYFSIFALIVILSLIYIDEIKGIMRGNKEMKLFYFTGLLIATVYLHRFFITMLSYFVNIGIITDMRIIDHRKSIFFIDSMESIDMGQIQNIVRIEEGFWPNLLGYGDIKIYLNASATVRVFREMPNVKFHFRCINRQKEVRQRALYKQRKQQGIDKPLPFTPPPYVDAYSPPFEQAINNKE